MITLNNVIAAFSKPDISLMQKPGGKRYTSPWHDGLGEKGSKYRESIRSHTLNGKAMRVEDIAGELGISVATFYRRIELVETAEECSNDNPIWKIMANANKSIAAKNRVRR